MDLNKYLGRVVRIDLTSGYYYLGLVLSVDENSLELKDKNGDLVTISEVMINLIKEVNNA